MPRHIDPVSLQLFVSVCEEGSIALAAEREAIVPSAVSKRLAALERALGVPLLVRARRGVKLTPAGEALLRQAREILNMIDHTLDELREFKDGVQGSVRVLASMSVLAESLPDDLARFLKLYGSVLVAVEEKVSSEIMKSVKAGRADFGICWDAADLSGLHTVPYRQDRLCVVAYPQHPLARLERVDFADALCHDMINVLPGSMMQSMLTRFASIAGRKFGFRLQVSNFESAFKFIAARLGIAVLPMEVARAMAAPLNLKIVPLTDPWATRQFVIATRAGVPPSAAARLLVAFLQERAREADAPASASCA